MKGSEKSKVQKIIEKLQQGNFDENDVDNLFTKLRAYSNDFAVFKEIANFAAHNDLRDRGITNQCLQATYYSMQFFLEYASLKKPIDITKPFPSWIKTLIKYQIDKIDEGQLKEKFSVGRNRLKSRIDKGFTDDKKAKTARLKNNGLSKETLDAIQYVMGFIKPEKAFSQDDVVKEIVGVLQHNDLSFDEGKIKEQSNRIALCVLVLIHNSKFDFNGHKPGYCRVTPEYTSISSNTRYVDKDGNDVDAKSGKLAVDGYVVLDKDGKDLTVAHPIMSTELRIEEWCSETLFEIETINLDGDLIITSDFKLDLARH